MTTAESEEARATGVPTRLGGKKLAELYESLGDACRARDEAKAEVMRLTAELKAVPAVLEGLATIYTPSGCGLWLYNKKGGRPSPVDLIVAGEAARVLQAVEAAAAGNW